MAKQLATLDRLDGRLLITFVPGTPTAPESGAVGAPRGGTKGAAMEEAFPVLRRLWAGEFGRARRARSAPFGPLTLAPRRCRNQLKFWTAGWCRPPSSGAAASRTAGCRRRARPRRWCAGPGRDRRRPRTAGRGDRPGALRGVAGLRAGPLDATDGRALGGARRGVDPATVVPVGLDELRGMLEGFLGVGFGQARGPAAGAPGAVAG